MVIENSAYAQNLFTASSLYVSDEIARTAMHEGDRILGMTIPLIQRISDNLVKYAHNMRGNPNLTPMTADTIAVIVTRHSRKMIRLLKQVREMPIPVENKDEFVDVLDNIDFAFTTILDRFHTYDWNTEEFISSDYICELAAVMQAKNVDLIHYMNQNKKHERPFSISTKDGDRCSDLGNGNRW